MRPNAIVFAYHDVGDRCLRTLLSAGWDVRLVVTHRPDPAETQWFADVASTAADYSIPVLRPRAPGAPDVERLVEELRPDFIFSFYYRWMLSEKLLGCARRGALNMHGSLLPRYRGRAPVNWAILSGETWTGATLHHMVAKADCGDIVDQLAVPILEDDTAADVMKKVVAAAEIVLARSLPGLADGVAARTPQDLSQGEYRGRRSPEDGRIDWAWPAIRIHNLVRAVVPPFPGAFGTIAGERWDILGTRLLKERLQPAHRPLLFEDHGECRIRCGDGGVLRLLAAMKDGVAVDLRELARQLAASPLPLA